MKEEVKMESATPMLLPYQPEQFWHNVRLIIHEEIAHAEKLRPVSITHETPGLTYKLLFKMTEVCEIFRVTKPTIYDWISVGRGRFNPICFSCLPSPGDLHY
jgi:hypothetical protein